MQLANFRQLESYLSFLYLWIAELLKVNRTLFCTSSFLRPKKNWLCYQATLSLFFREGLTTGPLLYSTKGCVVWFTVCLRSLIYYAVTDHKDPSSVSQEISTVMLLTLFRENVALNEYTLLYESLYNLFFQNVSNRSHTMNSKCIIWSLFLWFVSLLLLKDVLAIIFKSS